MKKKSKLVFKKPKKRIKKTRLTSKIDYVGSKDAFDGENINKHFQDETGFCAPVPTNKEMERLIKKVLSKGKKFKLQKVVGGIKVTQLGIKK